MQCKLVARVPEGPSWHYEIKFDGYRALALKTDTRARLISRRGNELGHRFPSIIKALSAVPNDTMLDGEVVAFGEHGRPSFTLLHRVSTPASRIFYYAFDVLAYRGKNVQRLPPKERRALLEDLLAKMRDPIRLSPGLRQPPSRSSRPRSNTVSKASSRSVPTACMRQANAAALG